MMISNGAAMTAPKAKPGLKAKDRRDEGLPGFSGILQNAMGQLAAAALSRGNALEGAAPSAGTGSKEQQSRLPDMLEGAGSPAETSAGVTGGLTGNFMRDPALAAAENAITANGAAGSPVRAGREKGRLPEEVRPAFNGSGKGLNEPFGDRTEKTEAPGFMGEGRQPEAATPQVPAAVEKAAAGLKTGFEAGVSREDKKLSQKDEGQPAASLKGAGPFGEEDKPVVRIKVAEPYYQTNEEFSKKLSDSVIRQTKAGNRSYEIQLEPEHLGKVEVRISVTDGRSVVELSCASHKTAQMLGENARTIGALMEQHSPNPVTVEVKQDEKPGWYQEQGNQGQGRERQPDENQSRKGREHKESGDFMERLRLGLYSFD